MEWIKYLLSALTFVIALIAIGLKTHKRDTESIHFKTITKAGILLVIALFFSTVLAIFYNVIDNEKNENEKLSLKTKASKDSLIAMNRLLSDSIGHFTIINTLLNQRQSDSLKMINDSLYFLVTLNELIESQNQKGSEENITGVNEALMNELRIRKNAEAKQFPNHPLNLSLTLMVKEERNMVDYFDRISPRDLIYYGPSKTVRANNWSISDFKTKELENGADPIIRISAVDLEFNHGRWAGDLASYQDFDCTIEPNSIFLRDTTFRDKMEVSYGFNNLKLDSILVPPNAISLIDLQGLWVTIIFAIDYPDNLIKKENISIERFELTFGEKSKEHTIHLNAKSKIYEFSWYDIVHKSSSYDQCISISFQLTKALMEKQIRMARR